MKTIIRLHAVLAHIILIIGVSLLANCGGGECKSSSDADEEQSPIIANDLSNQKVTCFAEDSLGHIWIGTFRGLNKYDVHEYHQYFCTDDTTSLPDNQINDILRDTKGRLWVATVNGLCLYTDRDGFRRIPQNIKNNNGLQLLETKDGRILVNFMHQLGCYDPQTDSLKLAIERFDPEHTFSLKCFIGRDGKLWTVSPRMIRCYNATTFELEFAVQNPALSFYSYMHTDGTLWLCGTRKVALFDTGSRSFKPLPPSLAAKEPFLPTGIDCIHPYGSHALLLSAGRMGLFLYDMATQKTVHQDEKGFPFEAPRFKVSRMFTDSQQNLWIGSVDQGYTVRYHYKERFNTNNYLSQRLSGKSVTSLAVDSRRNLWITTLTDGLFVYNMDTREVKNVSVAQAVSPQDPKAQEVSRIVVDRNDNVWLLLTFANKVLRCRYNGSTLTTEKTYSVFMPMSMADDEQGNVWIGTCSNQMFVCKQGADMLTTVNAFKRAGMFIPGILPLGNGELWVSAFMQPVMRVNASTLKAAPVPLKEGDWQTCISRSVFIPTDIMRDSHGDIWFGTVANGLLRYSATDGHITPVKGTPCRDVESIEEDSQGNIWVGTQYGLGKYDRASGKFTNYYAADGIGGNQFYDRSSCRLPDGTLVFGGTHGLTFFNPNAIGVKRNVPLIFEDLKIHNQLVISAEGNAIDKHLSHKPTVRIKHWQNGFSISFSALDYCEHERVHYYYMMEGFDKYWIDARNNREAYYANLPAGKYTFRVKVTNNDKSIAETENSLTIVVRPALWLSWWAWCLYVAVVAAIAWTVVRSRMRIRQEQEAARKAEADREQEQRVNKMNMSFFANVSHEFRTPLTMISGPVSMLCESHEVCGENKRLLLIVRRSVARMLRLVNQMLDFNKLENDTLRLQVSRADIIEQLKTQADVFSVNAKEKGITFTTYGLEDTFLMWLDADKIDKITGNLLSNAMKFTPRGGKVSLSFDADSRNARITVADTGCGIPENQLEKVFERYYQVSNHGGGTYNWGTGIGLYYARALAVLHHGTLTAANQKEGTGAVFTLLLPLGDGAYTTDEYAIVGQEQNRAFPLMPAEQDENIADRVGNRLDDDRKKLLVVDDDTEVVNYLKALFSPYYNVVCRFDAESALLSMTEETPDLVLSDVVMPGTSGYELCRRIKDDLQLCHIPVILVTAKATTENQVEGLNTGADAYVTKPFDPKYLLALIQSQLKNREKVRNILSRATQTDKIDENVLSPQDNAFMTDMYKLMEQELGNSELDVARMTTLLGISRTKFYYKVKGLTGESPSVFFKTYKLNRAAELIKEGRNTVSEIAYMTGFSTLSHFSTVFKKHFGVAPSEYGKTNVDS